MGQWQDFKRNIRRWVRRQEDSIEEKVRAWAEKEENAEDARKIREFCEEKILKLEKWESKIQKDLIRHGIIKPSHFKPGDIVERGYHWGEYVPKERYLILDFVLREPSEDGSGSFEMYDVFVMWSNHPEQINCRKNIYVDLKYMEAFRLVSTIGEK